MTEQQFAALLYFVNPRVQATRDVLRLHYVDGLTLPEAARQGGMHYQHAHRLQKKVGEILQHAEALA